MKVLVAYASKHGATTLIAERIGDALRAHGLATDVQQIKDITDLSGYDAFVVGGAVYFGSWMKEVTSFVEHNAPMLAEHPVWLFSSGPLGTQPTDAQGHDLRTVSAPKQLESVASAVNARDHHVFFGALDHNKFGVTERLLWALPASRSLFIEGDFRDWVDVETWAAGISDQLQHEAAPVTSSSLP
jgi:menaquinone-dependent protoporphyrinogen oxidase